MLLDYNLCFCSIDHKMSTPFKISGYTPAGWLDVMLDHKLMQDNNRGLGQSVEDSVPTFEPFKLIVERRLNDVKVFLTYVHISCF